MSLPQLVSDLNIPAKCINQQTSIKERGRRFVIHRQQNEIIYCIKVDGCWLDSADDKKVDYLFWCANSKQRLSLVELKGKNFGRALAQIESTLQRLYQLKPQLRQFAREGGICAYVVLSRGQAVSRRLKERARMKKEHNVVVQPRSQRLEINGVDNLC